MSEELRELTGGIIIATFMLNFSFYVLKYIFSHYNHYLKEHPKLSKSLVKIFKFSRKYHVTAGILIIVFLLIHLIVMSQYVGWSITGLIAASLMIIEIAFGAILKWLKPKSKIVRICHRFISFAIILSIIVHVI